MPGPAGEGMAPLRNRSEDAGREWVGEGARLLRRNDVSRRQDTGSEDKDEEGRRRFRFGNNNGGGGGNDGENDREGRFGGFFRSGGRGGNDNNNGRGGNDNGGGTGNDNGGTGNGNGSGSGSGNGRGDGNGNGFGGGRGDGNGNGFGEGRFGDRRFGEGFGFGRDRNRNNGDGNSSQTQNSPAETPSPSPSPQPQPPSTSTAPPPPPPETTTATESAPSPEVAPSTTVEASSAFNPGVILLQSAVTGGPTAEANPTVTAFIPLMTPSNVADSTNLSESPVNADPNASSGAGPSISLGPSPTPLPNDPPTGGTMGNGGGIGSNNSNGEGPGTRIEAVRSGMDPTAERILISVGSIGGFILLCFIMWMVWRTTRKPRKNDATSSGFSGLPRGIASKIPFLKGRGWQSLGDSTNSRSPSPSYREKANARAPSSEGFFGSEKMHLQQQPPQQAWPLSVPDAALPELDPMQAGNMPQPPQQAWPQSVPDAAHSELGPIQASSMRQPPSNPGNVYTTASRPSITVITNMPAYGHQPQESFSSTNAAHFGAILMGNNTASPLQTGVSPASYYNQTLRTQQLPGPYNPIYRQPSHAISEVSSLSSGFGDGEFLIADTLVTPPPATAVPGSANNSPRQYTARFSWMSQPHQGPGPVRQNSSSSSNSRGRRETVYTETSEDQPARFRSVTSWVDQQTGRIKRAQKRGQDEEADPVAQTQVPGNPGIPGIHNPPSEQSFGMMMDDDEKPRRVDVVGLALGKKA